jgi:hypothetical protein
MSSTFTVRVWTDVEFEIELEMEKYIPAKLTGHPDTWSPEEGGEVNVLSIKTVSHGINKKEQLSDDLSHSLGSLMINSLTDDAVLEVYESIKMDDDGTDRNGDDYRKDR